MAPYRLLVVNHAVDIGGSERGLLFNLLANLDRRVLSPAVACPHRGELTDVLEKMDIEYYTGYPSARLLKIRRRSLGSNPVDILLYPFDMLVSVIRLARLIRRMDFDLVLTNSEKANVYGSLAGRLARKPVVWWLHDIVDREAFSRFNVWLLKFTASRLAEEVITVSRAARDAFVRIGVDASKVKAVYNGVVIPDEPARGRRDAIRAELGIDVDAPVAALVGRLVDWKGPEVFLRAVSDVSERIPNARFLMVGDAVLGERSYVDHLKEECSRLGLGDKVVFTGLRDDVPEVMASVDLLVHASVLPEPFGRVIAEAMAQECPVVATDAGGVPEIVKDEVTGLLVPPGDAGAMAEAMARILSEGDLGRRMGIAGRRRVSELFDIKRSGNNLQREILGVLGGSRERTTS